jgi:NADPH:quinone reductase-like Zn-dependent oxidoreductase
MKAIRYHRYGSPDVLELRDVDPPAIGDDEILIRVRAASVNPLDLHYLRGTPYLVRLGAGLTRPKVNGLGADVAGYVEAVGRDVTQFRPADEVFGVGRQTLAEYVQMRADGPVAAKPATLTYEQAAAVPVAALTALQALRDKGGIRPGYRVLVNGAAGGVGTFAVQLAKVYGAEVTGVCSARNVDLIRAIGADRVVDYTREDFTRTSERYDLIVDLAGGRRLAELRRVLTPTAVVVAVGGPDRGRWIGPFGGILTMRVRSSFTSQTVRPMLTNPSTDDLAVLRELLESGKVSPIVDRMYRLNEAPEALRYLETGHARGKVVITV